MAYTVLIKRQVQKKLQSLSRADRIRIAEKIEHLGYNPKDTKLDVKKLKGQAHYRLRVGSWRIIFDRQDDVKLLRLSN